MRSLRCWAHAAVVAVALVSWGGVAWFIAHPPTANDALRLPFFTLLMVAGAASILALAPVVLIGYVQRGKSLDDTRQMCQAFYWWGRSDERRQHETGEPVRRPAFLRAVD